MERKRVNITIDPATYDKLQKLKKAYGFKNTCELVVAFVHILLDRTEEAAQRRFDLPREDGQYIDTIFDDLSDYEKTPSNTNPPKQHRNRYKMD